MIRLLYINIIFIFVLCSCSRPNTRTYEKNNSNGTVEIIYTTESNRGNGINSSGTSDSGITVQTESGQTTKLEESIQNNPDLMNCTWSMDGESNFVYSHESIGGYNICFAPNSNKAYIQIKSPKTSYPVCLFPTTNYDNGGTTYIGDAICANINSNQTIYPIQFYKNRQNYESYTITGAMIMYDEPHRYAYPYYGVYKIPDAYLICIQALYTSLIYSNTADTTWCDTFSNEAKYVYHSFTL